MSDVQKTKFGDLVSNYHAKPAPKRQMSNEEGEDLLAAWAKALGLAPDAVILEFRRDSYLSTLIRETFSVLPYRSDDKFATAVAMVAAVRSEGIKGRRVFEIAKERLAAKDATGKAKRPLEVSTLETYEKMASQARKKFAEDQPLASLFMPEGYLPPRSTLKLKNGKKQ